MGYALIAPLPGHVAISAARLYGALKDRFSEQPLVSVILNTNGESGNGHVELRQNGWSLRVRLEDAPHVLEESKELAALYAAGRPDSDAISQCDRRITIDSDEDEAMAYFNCYVAACETVESLGAVALFDPLSEVFINDL